MTTPTNKPGFATLVAEWGNEFPGKGADLPLARQVRTHLPILVSTFGLLAHVHESGEIHFPDEDSREEVVTAMRAIVTLFQSVNLPDSDWDDVSKAVGEDAGPYADSLEYVKGFQA